MYEYDIIIIGAGIAGLYAAYNIQKINPTKTFIIIERDKKEWIGGRIGNDEFYGTQVVIGAGIGRKNKDYLLIKLLKELHIKTKEFNLKTNYADTVCKIADVSKIISFLKKEYKKAKEEEIKNKTFSQFAIQKLGKELYSTFRISAGYTDYENADIYDVLYYYGMDDNTPGWNALSIPWKELVLQLCSKIGMDRIKYKTTANKIEIVNDGFLIETDKGSFKSVKVIIATNINGILKLVPGANKTNSLYHQIHGQTFLRVYGKFPKESSEIMAKYVPFDTYVPGPLHRIIPYGNNVFMIAYTDNADAISLKDNLENNTTNRDLFVKLLECSLGIPKNTLHLTAIKGYYWPIGTHYYSPLKGFDNRKEFIKKAQHPFKNMLVVGEVISLDQGWTEGALESVQSVLNNKWLNTA